MSTRVRRPKQGYTPGAMQPEIRIAAPCTADWDRMAGDDRVRYCAECKLSVYNFSTMTDVEVRRIVAGRQGRLCARFYRRADGTMLTQDCPMGFRGTMLRASRVAGAALAAVLSLSTGLVTAAQEKQSSSLVQIQAAQEGLALTILDAAGAAIPKARVSLVNEATGKKLDAQTDASGMLRLADLPSGSYEVTASSSGFITLKLVHFAVPAQRTERLELAAGALMGVVVTVENPYHKVFHKFVSGIRRLI